MAGWAGTLLSGQHQQLGVDDQQFGGGVFEMSACLDPRTNGVEPVGGDGLDTLLAAGHEREGPQRMAVPVGAMTGGLSAAAVRKRERARKSVVRDLEARPEQARAAAEPGGIRAAGRGKAGGFVHLIVIIPADRRENKTSAKWF